MEKMRNEKKRKGEARNKRNIIGPELFLRSSSSDSRHAEEYNGGFNGN